MAKIGVILFVLLIFTAIFAPLLAPHDPTDQNLRDNNLPPVGMTITETETETEVVDGEVVTEETTVEITGTTEYMLGTDQHGHDMLSRVIYGARTSMFVGLFATMLATIIGVSIGLSAGYYRGWVDDVLMRSADVMLAFPSLIFAIVLIGLFGAQTITIPDPVVYLFGMSDMPQDITLPGTVIFVIGAVSWVWFARIARGESLSIVNQEYVKSAKSLGGGDRHILRRHILPNSITPLLIFATIQVAFVIILESGLAFLGFTGTNLSWGYDIANGRARLASSWWIATFPGVGIMLAVFAVNLIGDWLRDALDPDLDRGEVGQ